MGVAVPFPVPHLFATPDFSVKNFHDGLWLSAVQETPLPATLLQSIYHTCEEVKTELWASMRRRRRSDEDTAQAKESQPCPQRQLDRYTALAPEYEQLNSSRADVTSVMESSHGA